MSNELLVDAAMRQDLSQPDAGRIDGDLDRALVKLRSAMKQHESTRRDEPERWDPAPLVAKAKFPERHKDRQLKSKGEAKEWWDVWTKLMGHMRKGGCLLALVGARGPGKTQLGVEWLRNGILVYRASGRYCTAMDFFLDIKATFRPSSTESERDIVRAYRVPDMLVIDEVSERSESAWEDRILTHLINCRYNDAKDTLLIANSKKEEFEATIGPSILSRLNETGGIIRCEWASMRT